MLILDEIEKKGWKKGDDSIESFQKYLSNYASTTFFCTIFCDAHLFMYFGMYTKNRTGWKKGKGSRMSVQEIGHYVRSMERNNLRLYRREFSGRINMYILIIIFNESPGYVKKFGHDFYDGSFISMELIKMHFQGNCNINQTYHIYDVCM